MTDGGDGAAIVVAGGAALAAPAERVGAARNPALVYLSKLTTKPSHDSMRSSLRTVGAMIPGAEGLPLEDVPWHLLRVEHCAALWARIVAQYKEPATAHRLVASLRGVVKASWRLRHIDVEERERCFDVLPKPPGSRNVAGRYVPPEEVRALYAHAGVGPLAARDRAMLVLLFVAGLRRAEAGGLTLAGVDRASQSVTVIGKRNKERTVPLSAGAFAHLEEWLAERGPDDGPCLAAFAPRGTLRRPLVPLGEGGVYRALLKIGKRCGVKVSPHDGRRTRITDLLALGMDLPSTQRLAGHENGSTTARYDMRGERELREQVRKLGSTLDGP